MRGSAAPYMLNRNRQVKDIGRAGIAKWRGVFKIFETHHASIVLANAGAAPPPPRPTSPLLRHMVLFLKPIIHVSIVFANGGACAPLSRASLPRHHAIIVFGTCCRYMMNRNRQMKGGAQPRTVFSSASLLQSTWVSVLETHHAIFVFGTCCRYMMNTNRQMKGCVEDVL